MRRGDLPPLGGVPAKPGRGAPIPARAWALALLAVLTLFALPAQAADKPDKTPKPDCDRACMEGLIDRYLTGLAAHDTTKIPFTRTVRFVENLQPIRLGAQGTWATVNGLGRYRHVFADPVGGRAAVITTVRENGTGAILDLVIKVEGKRISEVESQIIRDSAGADRYEALAAPEALWLQPVPVEGRIPRQALADAANKYFSGMQRNDPKGDYSFFDPDCNRLEHATKTTNVATPQAYGHSTDTDFSSMGCQAQFQTGFLGFVTELRDRRFMVIDEERQAVFAWVTLDHNGTVRVLHLSTGKDFVLPPYFNVPRTLQVGEAFRMRGDKIHRIEMTLIEVPYGMRPDGVGTASAPAPAPAPPAQRGKAPLLAVCARNCLSDLLVRTLQAMADHRPSDAPFAPNVRYTENGQTLKPGDGLWQTATAIAMPDDGLAALGPAISAYKLFLADPATGQAACLCALNENGTPGMMALRIKVVAGKVTEAEAIVVREEVAGARGGTLGLFRTAPLAEFTAKGFTAPDPQFATRPAMPSARQVMAIDVGRWLDTAAYNNRAAQAAGIEGASRLNGRAIPAPPTADVRGRRTLVADEDTGLILFAAVLDHDGKTPPGVPRSNLLAGVMKIDNGAIQRVEAIERWVPYGMTTGWGE